MTPWWRSFLFRLHMQHCFCLMQRNDAYSKSALDIAFTSSIWQLLRCLVHIINLAMQALLKAHSKSQCYDPNQPEAHLPDIEPSEMQHKVGLICAISVKVHLSILIVTICHILKLLHCTCPRNTPHPSAKSYSTQSKIKLVVNQNNFSLTCPSTGPQPMSCWIIQRTSKMYILHLCIDILCTDFYNLW